MGLLDTFFQVNAPRSRAALADLEYAKQEDRQKSGNIRTRQGVFRQEALQTLERDPNVVNNEYFGGDQDKFNAFKTDLERRQGNTNRFKALTVSDMTKILGKKKAVEYINDTGLAGTYFGPGTRLDGQLTNFELDETGEYVLTNPTVRVFDQDTGRFYSANATRGGEKVSDLFRRGGDAAVQEGSFDNVPLSFVDELDSDYITDVQGRTGGDERLAFFQPYSGNVNRASREQDFIARQQAAEGDTQSADAAFATADAMDEQEKLEQERIAGEARQDREANALYNYGFLQEPGSGTDELGEFDPSRATGRIGTSLYNSLFVDDTGIREDGQFGMENREARGAQALSSVLTSGAGSRGPGSDKISEGLGQDFPVTTEGIKKAGLSGYAFAPGGLPFDMTEEQFLSLAPKQRESAMTLAKNVSDKNLQDSFEGIADTTTARWDRKVGSTSSEANVEIERDKPVIEAAKKFYEAEGMTDFFATGDIPKDNKLVKRLMEQPELMKEFKADPTAFATKYGNDTNALFGPPKNVSLLKQAVANIDIKDMEPLEKALVTRDTDKIREIARKMKTTSEARQQELAAELQRTGGDFGRATNKERIGLYFEMISSLPPESPLFEMLTRGSNFTNMVESGVFNFNQMNAETERFKAQTARMQEERMNTPVGADVTIDEDALTADLFGAEATPESIRTANTTLNIQLAQIAEAARIGPLNPTNRKALVAVTGLRSEQMKDFVKDKTDPSILDFIISGGSAKPADLALFKSDARVDATVDGEKITSAQQWYNLSEEERRRVKLKEPNSGNDISPQALTSTFGPGAVETLIFRGTS
jgi:hypothetical protein